MPGSTTAIAKPNTLGDFFANAWDILTAETLDEEESVGAWNQWNSRRFSERRKQAETYDYIFYEERDRATEAPPKDQMVNQKNYGPDSLSKIDESELPTTIAVVSHSPVLKNRFMAQEYKEIGKINQTLLEIEEEDLNSVGIDLLAAQDKVQVRDNRLRDKRAEKIKSYAAAREKVIEKKQNSQVSEKESRKKRSFSRNRMNNSDRSSRSSRSPHKPHSAQVRRKQTSTRASKERAAPRSDGHRHYYDEESRDPVVEHYARYEYHEPATEHYARYECRHQPPHHRQGPTRTNMYNKRHYMHDDPEISSYYDSKRSSSASIQSAKRFLGFKR